MSCKLDPLAVCNLNRQNGFLTNGYSTKSLRRAKASTKMGVQHFENYELKPVVDECPAPKDFRFRPPSPTSRIFPNVEKKNTHRSRRTVKRNWSANRMFFGVKSGIEKIHLQDQIDHAENIRKIHPINKYSTNKMDLSNDLTLWKCSIEVHEISWRKQVIKRLYCPPSEPFYEADELLLETANDNIDEEDCF